MPRILVKAAPGLTASQLRFGAAAVPFTFTPLFKSIGPQPTLGAVAGNVWQVLTPPPGFAEENSWDVCHALLQQGFGVAGASPPEFAEPDLQQQWITGKDSDLGMSLAQSCDTTDPQSTDFPHNNANPFWFRDSKHSQFDAAIAAIGGPNVASKVRIAHFDTGYDAQHHTLPKRLRRDIARNFVDDGNPNDASDQTSGILNNLGTVRVHSASWRVQASRDNQCWAVRLSRKLCRFGSLTGLCFSATARSARRSIMSTG